MNVVTSPIVLMNKKERGRGVGKGRGGMNIPCMVSYMIERLS